MPANFFDTINNSIIPNAERTSALEASLADRQPGILQNQQNEQQNETIIDEVNRDEGRSFRYDGPDEARHYHNTRFSARTHNESHLSAQGRQQTMARLESEIVNTRPSVAAAEMKPA